MQAGFDFGDVRDVKPIEMPPGTWERRDREEPNLDAVVALASRVRANLAGVPASVRAFFEAGVLQFEAALAVLTQKPEVKPWEFHDLKDFDVEVSADDQEAFKALCRQQSVASSHPHGVDWKVREHIEASRFAVRVEGVGILCLVKYFTRADAFLEFVPPAVSGNKHQEAFFHHSYEDDAQSVALPYKVWGKAYAADKMAYSGKGKASVPTFRYGGREYLISGSLSGPGKEGRYSIGTAWALCPRSQWTGNVYSYEAHTKMLDRGIQQRSDYRGIAVLVRGQEMVIESAMFVYDLNAQPLDYSHDDEDVRDEESDPSLLEREFEDEDEEALV